MTNARPNEVGTGAVMAGGHDERTGSHRLNAAQHAAAYARAGLHVLPLAWPIASGCSCGRRDCPSPAKHPLTPHGKDDATTDIKRIGSWWAIWPEANIGLRPAEDVAVLDVDPRAGGAARLAELLAACGVQLPATLTANTGGGGIHAWYQCPGPYRGRLCEGVDIKSSSGYLVAPPSRHMSGRSYSWATEVPITTAPSWLRKLIRRPEGAHRPITTMSTSAAADGLVRTVASAQEGGRNRALHWAACRAAERGAPADLLDQLRAAARSVGLDEREIEKTIRSAMSTGRSVA
ncbi:bifunctional DNA primase/polymerase [Geodermatophilus chilensis]|uniref:bifunctional DNA primase/polymerase n=1 Tax=Geodermatophilus chilensis TaxID=2035835 RepID=UPI000C262BF7|nr:bifunctional DNA primase/polymerase [Geodermatophilus chilensis]